MNTTSKATSQSLLIKSLKGVCACIFILHVHMCPYTWKKIHNCFLCENGARKNKVRFELGWKFLILRSWRSKLKRYPNSDPNWIHAPTTQKRNKIKRTTDSLVGIWVLFLQFSIELAFKISRFNLFRQMVQQKMTPPWD